MSGEIKLNSLKKSYFLKFILSVVLCIVMQFVAAFSNALEIYLLNHINGSAPLRKLAVTFVEHAEGELSIAQVVENYLHTLSIIFGLIAIWLAWKIYISYQSLDVNLNIFKKIVDLCPEAVSIKNENGVDLFTNHKAKELLLFNEEEQDFFPLAAQDESDHALLLKRIQTTLVTNKTVNYCERILYNDNKKAYYSSTMTPLRNGRKVRNVLVVSKDITKEAQLKREAEKYRSKFSCAMEVIQDINDRKLQQQLHQLRRSVANNEFQVYLQPRFDSRRNVVGAEALVRWLHPTKGMVLPEEFISVAEENNLIIPLGKQVITQSCELLHHWQQSEFTRQLSISINISVKQLCQREFEDWLISTVEQYDVNSRLITLDIRDSFLDNLDNIAEKLGKLREHGFKISLDNFGTGDSSLLYLNTLPVDELKIDGLYTRDMASNKSSLTIVKSMIEIGQNFKLAVTAQGVENEEQLDLLHNFGVSTYQGYLMSRPVNVSEFEKLVRELTPDRANVHKLSF